MASVVSNSVQPHRQQPTRLPCPWDSPGKNTGVGCHFLLQCMKLKSESEVLSRVRLLATPWTAAYQAPPFMGFSRQEYWSGVPLPSPTISHSLLKFLSIESVIVSNYLILCLPLLLLPSIFPSIRVFSNESALHIRCHFHFSLSCIGEGNGNPLQCYCLEHPRDGGAWWAAIYGVAQSWTGLKRFRSSSSRTSVGPSCCQCCPLVD